MQWRSTLAPNRIHVGSSLHQSNRNLHVGNSDSEMQGRVPVDIGGREVHSPLDQRFDQGRVLVFDRAEHGFPWKHPYLPRRLRRHREHAQQGRLVHLEHIPTEQLRNHHARIPAHQAERSTAVTILHSDIALQHGQTQRHGVDMTAHTRPMQGGASALVVPRGMSFMRNRENTARGAVASGGLRTRLDGSVSGKKGAKHTVWGVAVAWLVSVLWS